MKLPICPLFNALRYNYIIHVIANSTYISFIKKTQEWRCTCYFIMYFGLSPCRHVRNKEHISILIINLTKIDNETAVVKIQQLCKLSRALIDLGGGNYKI